MLVVIKLGPVRKIYRRSVYTTLDWLGDVGGLSDALQLIGKGIMFIYTLAFGNPLSAFLLKSIFLRDSKRAAQIPGESKERRIAQLSTRKVFKMSYRCCFCLNRKKDKRLAEFGLKRAMKELEVD